MNERIQKLAEQAGFIDFIVFNRIESKEQVIEKFAQLIVQECIDALEEKIYCPIDHEGDEVWIDVLLKEHFGVEE
jgi:hypothetical protein